MRPQPRGRALLAALVLALTVTGTTTVAAATPPSSSPTTTPAASPPTAGPVASSSPVLPATTIGGPLLDHPVTVVDPAVSAPPVVHAGGWVVADLDTGQVLAAKDAHGRFAPASTLKILTALTVIPKLDPRSLFTATSADAAIEGSKVGVVPDHAYRVSTLLLGMLMVSGNDAAHVLADHLGGEGAVAKEMTAVATGLQADDTVAKTVTGLDAPGQTTSAYDLALIAKAALKLPSFAAAVKTRRYEFAGKGVHAFEIDNHNLLLGRYPGTYGVKNGYTDAARASYVGTAVHDGHHLIVTMIDTDPNFLHPAEALLDWGFAHDATTSPVGILVGPLPPAAAAVQRVARAAARAPVAAPAVRHDASGFPAGGWAAIGVGAALVVAVVVRRRSVTRRRRRRYGQSRPLRLPPL